MREYSIVYPLVDLVVKEGNLDAPKGSENYLRLAAEVLKAQIHLLQIDRQQSTGDYSYNYNEPLINQLQKDMDCNESYTLIKTVAAEYWTEKVIGWSPRTLPEYRIYKDTLLEFIGEATPIYTIDYQKGREYKAHLDQTDLSEPRKDSYLGFAKQLWKWAIQLPLC